MLPKVENPIPETIGLTTIVALGAGISGLTFYLIALAIQLLCRQ
jgi:hypothetical protein